MSLGSHCLLSASLPWCSAASCLRLSSVGGRLAAFPGLQDLSRSSVRGGFPLLAFATQPRPVASSFGELSLGQDLLSALDQQQLSSPTEIQSSAIPAILEGGDVLLASHTGSGKTLAYLLPLVRHLKQQEAAGASTRPKRPRALVLGPTRELTDQILTVAKSLSHSARFRSTCLNGGRLMSQQANALAAPQDIVIATPQRIAQHAEKGNLYFGDVEVVVLDEADTMFDRGFGPEVRAVLKPLRAKADPARCILVVATLSNAVRKLLDEEFPRLRYVETSTLHKAIPGARHTFVPIAGTENKLDQLAHLVGGDQAKGRRSMVFCNTLGSCRAAEHFLVERELATVCYHGDIPLAERKTALRRFAGTGDAAAAAEQPALVCTDLAARGLDIPGRVDHVINFDFPLNSVDFLHRTGRTARAGASGRVTSLVTKRDRMLAQRIEKALSSGQPIDQLSGAPDRPIAKPETIARRSADHAAAKAARKGIRGASRGQAAAGKPPASFAGGRSGRATGNRGGAGQACGSRSRAGSAWTGKVNAGGSKKRSAVGGSGPKATSVPTALKGRSEQRPDQRKRFAARFGSFK